MYKRQVMEVFKIHEGDSDLVKLILYFFLPVAVMMLPIYMRYGGSAYKTASGNGFLKTILNLSLIHI